MLFPFIQDEQNGECNVRGVKFGCKPKLTLRQINHTRKLIEAGQRRGALECRPDDALSGAFGD
jgi:hypothetical protein